MTNTARTKLTITYWNGRQEIVWIEDFRKAERIAATTRKLKTVMGVRVGV